MGRWTVVDRPGGVHVLPDDDLIEHTESAGCFCAPKVRTEDAPSILVRKPDGTGTLYQYVRQVVVHEALDGREQEP